MRLKHWLATSAGDLIATRDSSAPASASPPAGRADVVTNRQSTAASAAPQRSLFGEILDWMFAPLLLLWPMSVVVTFLIARSIADAPFDRALKDRAIVLSQQVLFVGRETRISFPSAAAELLRRDTDETVSFQVLDPRGELVAGDRDLPVPGIYDFPETARVKLRTIDYRGYETRVAYTYVGRFPAEELGRPVLIQVAEGVEQRNRLANEIIKGVIFPQFIILPIAIGLVWFGLSRGLAPLKLMQERIRSRRPDDRSALERREAPEEIAPLVDAFNELLARQGESMARQQRFVADAAHQMKTPLAGIRTQAELALRESEPQELQRSLRQLARSSERAAHMVSQLLALARMEGHRHAAAFETVDLKALARRVVAERAADAIARGVDYGFEDEGQACRVRGQALMLQEMLANLVDNALRYTPAGGIVTVRVRRVGAEALLEVEDSGRGVPSSERGLIFERFYRVLDGVTEGSGLGLSIVREIAEQHDAWIEVRDGLAWPPERGRGCGTAFVAHFPALRAADA